MGFSQRQAKSIINFREKSGGFKTPEDLKKVYVISDEMYAKRENLSRSHSKGVVILIAIVIAIQSIVLILKSSGYFKEPLVPVNRVIVDSSGREVTKIVD